MKPKYFAEFYHKTISDNKVGYQPACGDRSVVILDGREHESSQHGHARRWARKYGYDGYRLCHGTFTNPNYLTNIVPVDKID